MSSDCQSFGDESQNEDEDLPTLRLNKSFSLNEQSDSLVIGFTELDTHEDWFRIIGFLMSEIYELKS